ncbi:MAG: TonB-dependent receptor [Gemmatimonadetes bacterium]|nr:TonB-dependent receptor [Gemmatimonadota bacterium]
MSPTRACAAAVAAAAVLAVPAAGQKPDSTAKPDSLGFTLQEVVVRATKPITTVGGASAFELRIDSLKLPPAPTLEMVLRELPALHIRRNTRGEAEISVRGSESRQVAVLVDGIPLNFAWDGRVDASIIPATAPQRIEFTRGVSSMLVGPNVLGGVVDIEVGSYLRQPQAASAQLSLGVDRHGGFGTAAAATVPLENDSGRWLLRAGLGISDLPGVPLPGGVAEPLPADNGLRVNTDSRSYDGFASIRFHGNSGAWFSATGAAFDASRGIAAELGVQNARFWRYPTVSRSIAIVSGGTGQRRALFGGEGDVELSLGFDRGRTEIDSYTGRDYQTLNGFEDGRDRTLTFRALADHSLGPRAEFRTGVTVADIRHDDSLPTESPRYRQRLFSLGAETLVRLVDEGSGPVHSLRLSLGGAYDAATNPETGGRPALGRRSQWGARLGLTMGLDGGATLLHGGISRRARFPALRELYSGALNRFAPNPALAPENLVALEGGVTTRLGRGEFQAVAFRHQVNDAVVRVSLPDRRFQRINLNTLRTAGVELLATAPIGRVTLTGDLTLQSISVTDTAGQRRRAENLPKVFGRVGARFALPLEFAGGVNLSVTGRQFCIDPGTGQDTGLDGGAIVSGEVSRRWATRRSGLLSRLETSLAIDNAGNRALFEQCGLPRPGRLLRLQVRLF